MSEPNRPDEAYLEPGVPEAAQVARHPQAPLDERHDATQVIAKAVTPAVVPVPRQDIIKAALEGREWDSLLEARRPRSSYESSWSYTRPNPELGQRPAGLSFGQIRALCNYDPIISSIILTRMRQMSRYAKPSRSQRELGFRIRFKGADIPDENVLQRIERLERYILNSGAEFNPVRRRRMKRDDFATYLKKATIDTLTLDAMPIEVVPTYTGKPHGFRAIDGASVYLAPANGFRSDLREPEERRYNLPAVEDVQAIRVLDSRVVDWFAYGELLYPVRNPRTDLAADGYGMAEAELMVRFITGFLNLSTYTLKSYEENHIPKGFLTMYGAFSDEDVEAFKSEWRAYVAGISNAWKLPILISQDKESGATFTKTGVEAEDMTHIKWVTFLVSLHCALWAIAPEEIGFESFSSKSSSLSDGSQESKLTNSKDTGLAALRDHHAAPLNELIQSFEPDAELVFTGDVDPKQADDWDKITLTFGEAREQQGKPRTGVKALDEAPINPTMQGIYMQASGLGQPQGGPGAGGDGNEEEEGSQGLKGLGRHLEDEGEVDDAEGNPSQTQAG